VVVNVEEWVPFSLGRVFHVERLRPAWLLSCMDIAMFHVELLRRVRIPPRPVSVLQPLRSVDGEWLLGEYIGTSNREFCSTWNDQDLWLFSTPLYLTPRTRSTPMVEAFNDLQAAQSRQSSANRLLHTSLHSFVPKAPFAPLRATPLLG
jgi:hypothetical protein